MFTLIFVVVAGGSLAAGWLLGITTLVYVALGVSALGLVLVVADWWRRRRQSRATAEQPETEEAAEVDSDREADQNGDDNTDQDESDDVEPALAPDSVVYVVAGRRRFHVPGCPSLDGGDPEELTLAEARDESFTPCTRCVDEASRSQLVRLP
ncbi:MAG TPA: hypothetical protein VG317_11505 [Pseudonocardiaceae bacterium]|nr:hypothetical protein [Pseudonocardiaceae bacterium]